MERPEGFSNVNIKHGICGILAVAVCAGVSYEAAYSACKRAMLPHQKRMGRATYHRQRCNALWMLGVKFTETTVVGSLQLRYFDSRAKPDTLYMLRINGHVLCYKNGFIQDQGHLCPLAEYRGRSRANILGWVEIHS